MEIRSLQSLASARPAPSTPDRLKIVVEFKLVTAKSPRAGFRLRGKNYCQPKTQASNQRPSSHPPPPIANEGRHQFPCHSVGRTPNAGAVQAARASCPEPPPLWVAKARAKAYLSWKPLLEARARGGFCRRPYSVSLQENARKVKQPRLDASAARAMRVAPLKHAPTRVGMQPGMR